MSWKDAQRWEKEWHGRCLNTYGEEMKQLLYANRMGLETYHNGKSPYNFDMGDTTILDIGAGPASLLLKATATNSTIERSIVEPMDMPEWVCERYDDAGINILKMPAEEFIDLNLHDWDNKRNTFDEAWIYNCLQHTEDPMLVVQVARCVSRIVRIFEWIDTPTNIGHPHTLTEKNLNEWFDGYGKVETLTGQANCYGKCYYGIFPKGERNE